MKLIPATATRRFKEALKDGFFVGYKMMLRFGVHVLPDHYYVPVSNVWVLERTRTKWAKPSAMLGVSVQLDEQVSNLQKICLPYQSEYMGNSVYHEAVSRMFGPGYGYIEAQALHAVVRYYKPRKVVEVGSGVSTYCTRHAATLNTSETGWPCRITCVEPHPSAAISNLDAINLLRCEVQDAPLDVFLGLKARDLLFIDSSHTVKPAGDVSQLILEVLPRLAQGVVVHFHDIYFPYDYQRDLLESFLQRMETPMLRAFLTFNERVHVVFCLSHLHYERQNELKRVFPEYDPQSHRDGLRDASFDPAKHFPSSIYLEM